ncbi:MAG: POT family MFS transporter [Cyclobacteriaceae bacterium]
MGIENNKMPSGISYIVGNEAAERFSYYGMKAILFTFMTQYLLDGNGTEDFMTATEANKWIHTFGASVYLFPILGALVSDIFWGKYRTIIILSILYCAGHIALAMNETRFGLSMGLTMIAIGSGGIKPCVSAHVGDQFTSGNKHLLERVFSYFYIAINVGAAISSILTPILLREFGAWLAFGLPGGLMIIATFLFWVGRKDFIAIEPVGWKTYVKTVFTKESLQVIKKLSIVYLFISVFWALFDQTASSVINQAGNPLVNRATGIFNWIILPDQVQALNPVLVLILVPLFSLVVYPYLSKKINLTPIKKITIGMFIAGFSFLILVFIQSKIEQGMEVTIYWQFLSYLILTVAEVMVSVTALEFSYTQAPLVMKSLIMGLYLLSVSLGNVITAGFNWFIQDETGNSTLSQLEYFGFFTILMFVTAVIFVFVGKNYKAKTYVYD